VRTGQASGLDMRRANRTCEGRTNQGGQPVAKMSNISERVMLPVVLARASSPSRVAHGRQCPAGTFDPMLRFAGVPYRWLCWRDWRVCMQWLPHVSVRCGGRLATHADLSKACVSVWVVGCPVAP
jgi:hypothetical protein